MGFERGDIIKFEGTGQLHRVCAYAYGSPVIPDGWPIDQDGAAMNPKFCELYEGAISAIPDRVLHGEFKPIFGQIKEYSMEAKDGD